MPESMRTPRPPTPGPAPRIWNARSSSGGATCTVTGSVTAHWHDNRYPSRTRSSPSWISSMIVGGGIVPATNCTRHDVQRPRPPQVAVISTPPSCAALRIVVPTATLSSRRVPDCAGFVRMTSETAIRRHCSAHPRGLRRDLELDAAGAFTLDGGRRRLRGQARGRDAAADERVAHGCDALLAKGALGGRRRTVFGGQHGEQLVEARGRLPLGEATREQTQRLLAQRLLAAVLRAGREPFAQRLLLERLRVGEREHRPQAQPNGGPVAQERGETVEMLGHLRTRRGAAGGERHGVHRERLDP